MNEEEEKSITTYEFSSLDLPLIDKVRESNGDFMSDIVVAANEVNKLAILAAGIIEQKTIDPEKIEVLRGNIVRLFKLYDSYLLLIVKKRTEIAFILLRSLAETIINVQYLLKHIDTDVHKKYKRASLAYEKDLEEGVIRNTLERGSALPIEHRMLKSIEKTYARSGLADLEKEEWEKTKWGLRIQDLHISGKAKDVGLESIYNYIFVTSSHFVHGSWHEIDFHHLVKSTDKQIREAQLSYTTPTPQIAESISILLLETLRNYALALICEGSAVELIDRIDRLSSWFYKMSENHENFLSKSVNASS